MVVLAASILTKQGKLLLSRQYREMPRLRIEGLLATFPKLIHGSSSALPLGRQHTFIESDSVRYVYQPVEDLYVVLVTNKSSNIVEDLETLRLLSKLVSESCPPYGMVDEEAVYESAFDLVFAFDEVIDWGGCRENVDIPQVRQFLEMYSHEERLAKAIKESKMSEAREEMRRKAQMIDRQKQDMAKIPPEMRRLMGLEGGAVSSASMMPSISSGAYSSGTMQGVGPMTATAASTTAPSMSSSLTLGAAAPGGASAPGVAASTGGRGLALGKARTAAAADDWLERMRAEGEVVEVETPAAKRATTTETTALRPATTAPASVPTSPVHFLLDERINARVGRDGGVEQLEIKGELLMQIQDPNLTRCIIHLQPISEAVLRAFQMRIHPTIDKTLWQQSNAIALKNRERAFPTGAATPLGLVKWRLQSTDESMLPLIINCWPSATANDTTVNIEYEAPTPPAALRDVVVCVPVPRAPSSMAPQIGHCDGQAEYDARRPCLLWKLAHIEPGSNGSLEFTLPLVVEPDHLFPLEVSFVASATCTRLAIDRIEPLGHVAAAESPAFTAESRLSTERYQIV
ncbi:hypothetical protein CDCA_CDCA01G0082 [Cyanidium caldarium]|uniref:Coatomer subunit delta n=1 Tax=Cyanidium caldarium TaxID=2771 RepID=A0AAV9INY0_CYACA|nr:hypothetical protein CDCA_CDCA01G0082 [Cyanidium caldarium]